MFHELNTGLNELNVSVDYERIILHAFLPALFQASMDIIPCMSPP